MDEMTALKLESLSFAYGPVTVLEDISLSLAGGEMMGVVGPNGSGKTTLIGLISRVLKRRSGEVFIRDRNLDEYSRRELARLVAVVPQTSEIVFPYTVEEMVGMGRYPYLGWNGIMNRADREACERAMDLTGVAGLRGRTLDHLSAGERQRVMVARALAQEPSLLLLDEASSFLDIGQELTVFEVLDRLRRGEGLSLLAVSHDLNLVGRFCQKALMLRGGRVLAEGRLNEVYTPGNLTELFGVAVRTGSRSEGGVSVTW